jgi:hypothetical protein
MEGSALQLNTLVNTAFVRGQLIVVGARGSFVGSHVAALVQDGSKLYMNSNKGQALSGRHEGLGRMLPTQ